jgi:DNA-binding SARP family transcriptional activator
MALPADGVDGDLAGFRFNVLGPFEVRYDQRPVHLTGVARSVLAVLTASPGRVVSVAGIVAGLWGTDPPDGAERAVASYVSRLRRTLGATSDDVDATALVVTRPPGYVLAVASSSLDAVVFERYLEQARRAATVGQPALAAERYRQALALWRGEAYAEFADHPFAHRQRSRLEEMRIAAVEARIDALLAAGSPASQVVADLESLVAEHPHRERMWVQLMTALYREGRQALPGSGTWRQAVLTPATAPPDLPDPVDGRTILVIDQFEEAFTTLTDAVRTEFVDWIVRTLDTGCATVVLTIRSDYYARCAENPALGDLVAANTVLVPRMAADELRQTIERPAPKPACASRTAWLTCSWTRPGTRPAPCRCCQ